MRIRVATSRDLDDIRGVHLAAFDDSDSEIIAQLSVDLMSEETTPTTLSLVAEIEDDVVGHVIFSPVTIGTDGHCQGYILAPLGVKPDCQKGRVGSKLVESGIEQLTKQGVDMLFVYGDPRYYGRFGFTVEAATQYTVPYKLQYPVGWQGLALKEGSGDRAPAQIACVPALSDPELW